MSVCSPTLHGVRQQKATNCYIPVTNTQKLTLLSFAGNKVEFKNFDVLLTVHLSLFISVITQLDTKNLVLQYLHFMPLHVSSTFAHHQELKIALHSLGKHHTYRWPSRAQVVSPLSTS